MTQPVTRRGTHLKVKRKNASTFDLICMATTKSLQKMNEFEDATVIDCDNPDVTPTRRSIKKSSSWSIGISGTSDSVGYNVLDADCDSEAAVSYQFVNDLPLAQGGCTWEGKVWYENLEITTEENGIVKFKGQLRGDGPLVRTPASA